MVAASKVFTIATSVNNTSRSGESKKGISLFNTLYYVK